MTVRSHGEQQSFIKVSFFCLRFFASTIGSVGTGIFTYMDGWFFIVNASKYIIHGSYGCWILPCGWKRSSLVENHLTQPSLGCRNRHDRNLAWVCLGVHDGHGGLCAMDPLILLRIGFRPVEWQRICKQTCCEFFLGFKKGPSIVFFRPLVESIRWPCIFIRFRGFCMRFYIL